VQDGLNVELVWIIGAKSCSVVILVEVGDVIVDKDGGVFWTDTEASIMDDDNFDDDDDDDGEFILDDFSNMVDIGFNSDDMSSFLTKLLLM